MNTHTKIAFRLFVGIVVVLLLGYAQHIYYPMADFQLRSAHERISNEINLCQAEVDARTWAIGWRERYNQRLEKELNSFKTGSAEYMETFDSLQSSYRLGKWEKERCELAKEKVKEKQNQIEVLNKRIGDHVS